MALKMEDIRMMVGPPPKDFQPAHLIRAVLSDLVPTSPILSGEIEVIMTLLPNEDLSVWLCGFTFEFIQGLGESIGIVVDRDSLVAGGGQALVEMRKNPFFDMGREFHSRFKQQVPEQAIKDSIVKFMQEGGYVREEDMTFKNATTVM